MYSPGADDGLFSITLAGALKFNSAPNYEAPADAGGNNIYNVCVRATDIGDSNTTFDKSFAIPVTDVATEPPLDITINGENIALNLANLVIGLLRCGGWISAGRCRCYGGECSQVTVVLKDAGGNTLHTMVTHRLPKQLANRYSVSCGKYTAPFAVKMGSRISSTTWGATYTDQWAGRPGIPTDLQPLQKSRWRISITLSIPRP